MRSQIGRKGTSPAVTTIVAMILLLAIVVIVYLIIGYGPGLLEQMANINKGVNIEDDIVDEIPISWDMVNAIKCSYYRCKNGCDSDEVKDIEMETGYGLKRCKEDFCDGFDTDGDGKVCGSESTNQMKINLIESSKIYREDLVFPECLSWALVIWNEDHLKSFIGDRTTVLVRNLDINETIGENACYTDRSFNPFYEGFQLNAGMYYINSRKGTETEKIWTFVYRLD